MQLPGPLLQRPAAETVRLVAQAHLRDLRHARARLDDPQDAEALHDFRVALRRLRSWFRAFRPELREAIRRGIRRDLRELAAHAGECRDLEVHLAWVRQEVTGLAPGESAGAAWLLARLALRKRCADARLRDWLDRRFPRLAGRIQRRLGSYRVPVAPGDRRPLPTAREVLRPRLGLAFETMQAELARVRSFAGERQAHRARIAGKRVRYLLEPFAGELPGAPEALARLKALQDVLGDLHDAQVFAAELAGVLEEGGIVTAPGAADRRPGVQALVNRLRARGEAAFGRFREAWHSGGTRDFVLGMERMLEALGRALPPAGVEVERKYLLRQVPEAARQAPAVEIEQGWLPGYRIVERLRRSRGGGTATLTRTIKAGTGLARFEAEEEIQEDLFDHLWPLTAGRRIRKRRYRIPAGGVTWEIDEFLDRELVLAEVELPDEAFAIVLPDWLAPWVVREVTGEAAYVNRNLAR